MGVVYKATDPNIGRLVALKTMRLDVHGIEHAEMSRRFRQEARAAGTLNHPNIVTIYDAHEVDGLFYIAMEYIEGETLQAMMLDRKALPTEKVIGYTKQICAGLDYAHGKGIIHRDIKPANIMITPHETVKIMDFGIAKTGAGLTSDGRVLGTPSYMSPEQVRGRPIDGRSDLFGLGVMLYEMVTGEKPFTGETITTIIYKIVNEQPIAPRDLDATVHPGLSAIVLKSLAKAPEQRYQAGAELARDLDSYKSIPVATLPSGMDAIYAAETAAITTRIDSQSRGPETGSTKVPAGEKTPEPPVSVSPKQTRAEWKRARRERSSEGRRTRPLGILLVLLFVGLMIYRGKHERRPAAEIPSPPPAPTATAPDNSNNQPEKPDQTANAIQTIVNDQLRKAGINPGSPDATTEAKHSAPGASARGSAAGHLNATLNLSSMPPGAQIELNGVDSGKVTPAVIKVTKGEHRIVLRFPGFKPAVTVAKVDDGQSFDYAPRLTPIGVPDSVPSVPGIPDMAALQKQIQEQTRQAQAFRQSGKERVWPGLGVLDIRTDPPGALVAINGRNRNKVTPLHSLFPAGDWQLTLTLEGYKPVTRTVHVDDRKVTNINEKLQPQ